VSVAPSTRPAPEFQRFRAEFPVFERTSYLNAGTEGPVPRRAAEAVRARVDLEVERGRCGRPYFEALMTMARQVRDEYAGLLGCSSTEVALTGSTTDGINTVLSALDLQPGDEIVTSEQEHPGLLAPLGGARRRHGASVRVAPFQELADHVSPKTKLVACSHISWVNGRVIDTDALSATGVPVLLDGAQGLGAVPVDVHGLGCHFYAASGQKWLCGPEGSGCLFVSERRLDELPIPWPGYGSLADPRQPLELEPAAGAARFDHGFPTGIRSSWTLASLGVLAGAGWDWIHDRAGRLAERFAGRLAELGLEVAPRGRSTLVSWRVKDPEAEVQRLAGAGFVVRNIPGFGVVRASVGAWSSEEELERLAQLAAVG
jgi:selenocysteine lyase/cysteine desulfurase